ncbi:hypothetical protein IC620_15155 [Hazenella sp. IB182357]|uniref:Uncharacterized protein n=1 Tax=Polycladospora coralii TaxID=2771432 RepID=A0A926NI34_9BACL|nr:hypothetical protein [Polycladospora coralii]MBD1373683.1 hypothetical protein [Polycladospora coralii]
MRARNYSQIGWKPELALDGFFFGISLGNVSTVYAGVRGGGALLRSEGVMRAGATARSKMGIKSPLKYMNIQQKYVTEVKELINVAKKLKAEEKEVEEIARTVHQMRRDIGVKFKNRTSPEALKGI